MRCDTLLKKEQLTHDVVRLTLERPKDYFTAGRHRLPAR